MDILNQTTLKEFILKGFSGGPVLQISVFITILFTYIVTLLGNVIMLVIIYVDHRLHTPMYFFLWNLSLLETLNISNIVPLMLTQVFSKCISLPKANCLAQSFVYLYLATIVYFLMPIMSFDRYVAICNPLHYTNIINGKLCTNLVLSSWLGSFFCVFGPLIIISRLPFCGPNIINHFFCDNLTIMKLACVDTGFLQLVMGVAALIMLLCSLGLTVVSYIFIVSVVLQIPSINGRKKVFSTCTSHLIMVTISYGTAIFIEVSPVLMSSTEVYKMIHMCGNIVGPLMNPFVYTFRNDNFKLVLKQCLLVERIKVRAMFFSS